MLEAHEACHLFPMMTAEEYSGLVVDMRVNGQRDPILLHEGRIVDGRNRYRACLEIGLEPICANWHGNGSVIDLVVSLNLHRRHLTPSQRAALALELEAWYAKEAKRRQLAVLKQNQTVPEFVPERHVGEARVQAAKAMGANPHYVSDAKVIAAEAPELLERVKEGDLTIPEAKKAVVIRQRAEMAARGKAQDNPPSTVLLTKDIRDLTDTEIAPGTLDLIVTDPPYREEYLPLYSDLGRFAVRALKVGGLLVAMTGQSFLPEVMRRLTEHLNYWWAACYSTPGASTQLWQRKVLCCWKPLLVYCHGEYKGGWFTDVMRSPAPDKTGHKWGQSIEGMVEIVKQFASPGMLICDPFCGAGATAFAAQEAGCSFIGVDISEECINITRGRLNDTA